MRKLKTIVNEKNLLNWNQTRNGVPLPENLSDNTLNELCRKAYKVFFLHLLRLSKQKNYICQ